MNNNQRTPEEILAEIKLRMIYDPSKSLDQNKEILEEQDYTTMAGNTVKAAGAAAGAGAVAGGAYGALGTSAVGAMGLNAAGYSAVGLGASLGINSVALAGAVGGGIITGVAALALAPIILWWMDKDNAKNKVAKLFKYCVENKEKIDQVERGLSDDQIFELSDKLYDALKGMGTNETAVYEVFNSLQTISDLAALITTFNSETSSEGEGDILQWLDTDIDMTSEWNQIYRPVRNLVRKFMVKIAKENPPKKEDIEKAKAGEGAGAVPGKATGGYKPCTGTYEYGCMATAIGEVQKCLGVLVDNKFGPKTLAALKAKANMSTFTDSDIATICQASSAASNVAPREQGLKMAPLAPRGATSVQSNKPGVNTKQLADLPHLTYMAHKADFVQDPENKGRLRYKGEPLSMDELSQIDQFLKGTYNLTRVKQTPKDYGYKYVWAKL